jgi:hypothetical protein
MKYRYVHLPSIPGLEEEKQFSITVWNTQQALNKVEFRRVPKKNFSA